jgi:hypothetical protein
MLARPPQTTRLSLAVLCAACAAQAPESDAEGEAADDAEVETEPATNIADVVYQGETTDEALVRLLDLTPLDSSVQLVLDAPSEPLLPRAAPSEFTFHLLTAAQRTGATPGVLDARPGWARYAWSELGALLGPIRVARAHGTPYNGQAFYLAFSSSEDELALQVFTGGTSYTPDAAAWQTLMDAAQPITLRITWATFEENEVVADGGPFLGTEFSFAIE